MDYIMGRIKTHLHQEMNTDSEAEYNRNQIYQVGLLHEYKNENKDKAK